MKEREKLGVPRQQRVEYCPKCRGSEIKGLRTFEETLGFWLGVAGTILGATGVCIPIAVCLFIFSAILFDQPTVYGCDACGYRFTLKDWYSTLSAKKRSDLKFERAWEDEKRREEAEEKEMRERGGW